jgi:uncharacterized membrane protein
MAEKLSAVSDAFHGMGQEPMRVLTDVTGEPFWTIVAEARVEKIDEFLATTVMILPHKEIGMAKMESTVTIARPVEEVFRFFLDLDRNARTTDPNVESVTKTPEGPTRPGTTFLIRQKALGATRETATTFVSIDPNRKIEINARLGPLRPRGAIAFDQTKLGTTVTVRLSPNPIGLLKLLSLVFARIGERVWDKRLARIKDALERHAHAVTALDRATK